MCANATRRQHRVASAMCANARNVNIAEHRPLAVCTGAVNCVALWTRPFSRIRQPFQGRWISRMPKTTKRQCLDHLQSIHRCWGTWPKALSSWHKPLWWNRPNRHTNRRVLNQSYTNHLYRPSKALLNGAMLLHPAIIGSLGWWPRCYIFINPDPIQHPAAWYLSFYKSHEYSYKER